MQANENRRVGAPVEDAAPVAPHQIVVEEMLEPQVDGEESHAAQFQRPPEQSASAWKSGGMGSPLTKIVGRLS